MLGRKIIVSINHGRDGSLFSFNYGPKNDTKSGFGVYEIKTQQLIGAILQIAYKKLIVKLGSGAIATAQYWYLYQVNALKCTPPSYKREFIG